MVTINKSSEILSLSEKDAIPPNAAWESISPVLLDKWLCLYPLHERHLKEVQYSHGKVQGIVEPHDIEYSTISVEYYTAAQVLHMTSQISYILAGASMRDASFPDLSYDFYPMFLCNLVAAEIYYTDFRLRFRHKVSNSVPQVISVRLGRVKHINGLLFTESELDFANSSATAKVILVMPLDSKG